MPSTPTPPNGGATPSIFRGLGKAIVGLLVLLLIAFVALEVVTLQAEQQTEQQRRAIAVAGGKSETERHVPDWLQSILGAEFHSFLDRTRLMRVKMSGEKVGDAELAKVAGLPDITSLDVSESAITNDGLKTIAGLKTLQHLNLRSTKVTDVGPLAALPSLDSLILNFSEVRESAFEPLTTFPRLRALGAGGLMMTDAGVAILAKCPHLEELIINGSVLGENGLQPLLALKGLTLLSLKESKYVPADVAAFKKALPSCKVIE